VLVDFRLKFIDTLVEDNLNLVNQSRDHTFLSSISSSLIFVI